MYELYRYLFDHGMRLLHVLLLLLIVGAGACAVLLILWLRGWLRYRRLQAELARARRYDPALQQALHNHLQHAVAHDFGKGLDFILTKSQETLARLPADEAELRDKQAEIVAKVYELQQRAENVIRLFGMKRELPPHELVSLPRLLEGVLRELFPFAEAQGVTLRRDLASIEPIPANRHLLAQVFTNVVHNAIKYSPRGGVVDVQLRLTGDGEKRVQVDVHDRGRGIEEKDKERLFQLHVRGDGLIEPGSGLGLYLARELAHLHGGDLVLVESQVNQGSTFRVVLPYR